METTHLKVLALLGLLFNLTIFSFGDDLFTGIWQSQHNMNPKMDSYLCIEKVAENEYFVVHVDPYGDHQFDYAEYGYVDEDGYLVINWAEGEYFYINNIQDELYQNWNDKDDMNANIFTRVVSKSKMK